MRSENVGGSSRRWSLTQALRTWRKLNEDVELAETDYRALGSKGEPTCESQ